MVLVGVLGAVVGSFLNVLIYRVPRGESVVTPRSRCPECGTPIRPQHNVPVVSWLLLRGRCRDCSAGISPRYPAVEALTAVAFAAVALAWGLTPTLLVVLPFVALLITVAGIDLDHRIVPNKLLVPAALWAVAGSAVLRPQALPVLLIAGGAAFGLLLIAALAYPGGMGMGDVKLAGVMGLYLGASVAPALLVAFLTGSVVGLVILVREGPRGRKRGLPFAPFLCLGAIVGLLGGSELVQLYSRHFLS